MEMDGRGFSSFGNQVDWKWMENVFIYFLLKAYFLPPPNWGRMDGNCVLTTLTLIGF